MPLRHFSSTALAAMVKADRPTPPPLVRDGKFDTRAIMRAAVALARHQLRNAGTWQMRMRAALIHIWKRAKVAMAASVAATGRQIVPTPAAAPARVLRRPASAWDRGYTRGTNRVVNGW